MYLKSGDASWTQTRPISFSASPKWPIGGTWTLALKASGKASLNCSNFAVQASGKTTFTLTLFGGGDPAQAPNPFLCRRVGTLPVIAEKPGTRGKVDYGTLAFLEQRITGLHVVEGSVEAGINGEVELVAGVVSQGDAGSRSLSIVNQNV